MSACESKAEFNVATSDHTAGTVHLVVQRCKHAKLLVSTKVLADPAPRWVEVGRGVVVFVSFAKGASFKGAEAAAKVVLTTPLLANPEDYDGGKPTSLVKWMKGGSSPRVSVLVVPQASLVSKVRGRSLQYHAQARKADSYRLYCHFVASLRELAKCECVPGFAKQLSKARMKAKRAAKAAAKEAAAQQAAAKEAAAQAGEAGSEGKEGASADVVGSDAGQDAAGNATLDATATAPTEPMEPTEPFVVADEEDAEAVFPRVVAGVFGNRQGFEMVTEGPMSHAFRI